METMKAAVVDGPVAGVVLPFDGDEPPEVVHLSPRGGKAVRYHRLALQPLNGGDLVYTYSIHAGGIDLRPTA